MNGCENRESSHLGSSRSGSSCLIVISCYLLEESQFTIIIQQKYQHRQRRQQQTQYLSFAPIKAEMGRSLSITQNKRKQSTLNPMITIIIGTKPLIMNSNQAAASRVEIIDTRTLV